MKHSRVSPVALLGFFVIFLFITGDALSQQTHRVCLYNTTTSPVEYTLDTGPVNTKTSSVVVQPGEMRWAWAKDGEWFYHRWYKGSQGVFYGWRSFRIDPHQHLTWFWKFTSSGDSVAATVTAASEYVPPGYAGALVECSAPDGSSTAPGGSGVGTGTGGSQQTHRVCLYNTATNPVEFTLDTGPVNTKTSSVVVQPGEMRWAWAKDGEWFYHRWYKGSQGVFYGWRSFRIDPHQHLTWFWKFAPPGDSVAANVTAATEYVPLGYTGALVDCTGAVASSGTGTGAASTSGQGFAVFLLTNVSGGSIWVGKESELRSKKTCNFRGGGLCVDKGGADIPVQYQKKSQDFNTYEEAAAAYCKALQSLPRDIPLTGGKKALVYGAEYWVDTAPPCK